MKIPTNFWKLFYMNLILMMHLSLCLALTSLLPQIAEQNGYVDLGNYSILAIYMAEFIFNILSPAYLKNKKFNIAFTFQALLVVPSFFASDYLTNCRNGDDSTWICKPQILSPISIIFTFILGAGLGGYFVVQNYYVSQCATIESSEIMFSTTYILMGLSSMLSGFYSKLMLRLVSRSTFFWVTGFIELGLSMLFLFIRTPQKVDMMVSGVKVNDSEIERETDNIKEDDSIKQNIMDMYKVFLDKSTYIYYPLFWMTGIIIGFEYGLLYQFINKSLEKYNYDEQTINEKTAEVYLFVGIAQTLGALINGIIKKTLKSQTSIVLYTNLLSIIVILALVESFIDSFKITIILGFFLGLADISGQFNSAITISEQYKDALPIYGIYFCFQNLSIALVIIQATLLEYVHLGYNLFLVGISQITVNLAMHYVNRKKAE
ncbi:unnamed protein product [Paramecium pentaurelia]|uniref:Uncharacterized protein n=1 Tax=Paramecium pentaurelia TaxID=43138 RepID=A0A8S1U2C6_9CILI|nr:unnamed protein product [Paramecium pentaurelia]